MAGLVTDLIQRVTWNNSKDQSLKDRVKALPQLKTGDNVDVHVLVKEGEKERVQIYSGVVIRVQGKGASRSFTVRKVSAGVGVERTFPIGSPAIDSIKVNSHGKVRKSRLYYLRALSGRSARLNTSRVDDGSATAGAASAKKKSEAGKSE